MLDEVLPPRLSTAFRPPLWPMTLITKHQMTNKSVHTTVDMPQGDSPSPYIFNILMDDYLWTVNTEPSRGLATLFVDTQSKHVVGGHEVLRTKTPRPGHPGRPKAAKQE